MIYATSQLRGKKGGLFQRLGKDKSARDAVRPPDPRVAELIYRRWVRDFWRVWTHLVLAELDNPSPDFAKRFADLFASSGWAAMIQRAGAAVTENVARYMRSIFKRGVTPSRVRLDGSPDQPRDARGRWAGQGSAGAAKHEVLGRIGQLRAALEASATSSREQAANLRAKANEHKEAGAGLEPHTASSIEAVKAQNNHYIESDRLNTEANHFEGEAKANEKGSASLKLAETHLFEGRTNRAAAILERVGHGEHSMNAAHEAEAARHAFMHAPLFGGEHAPISDVLFNVHEKLGKQDATYGPDTTIPRFRPFQNAEQQARIDAWRVENLRLIKNASAEHVQELADLFKASQEQGLSRTELVGQIMKTLGTGESRAKLIASDQTTKFNGTVQATQQQAAGITEFVWSTSKDGAVRPTHRALEGKTFSWAVGAPDGPDHVLPGQPIRCRCQAIPKIALFEGID